MKVNLRDFRADKTLYISAKVGEIDLLQNELKGPSKAKYFSERLFSM